MKDKGDNNKLPVWKAGDKKKDNLQGYPLYPASEDVYNESHIKKNIDPEDVSRKKDSIEKYEGEKDNEKDFMDDVSGSDLDVPGSELDDNQENIGSEDEENNYYSIGGDDHEDLDEDKGD
jgi:hypothetical protein